MNNYRRKTIERWKADVMMLLGFMVGLLVMGVIFFSIRTVEAYRSQEFLSPLADKEYAIWTVEKEVVKEVPVYLNKRTLDCVNNYPEVADMLREHFPDDPENAYELFCRESSFNKKAINPSSGACGLVQALPCSKLKCDLEDLECQVKWGKDYIDARYGTVEEAVKFHDRKNWY